MLGRRIAARPRPPATVRDLEIALLEEWNSIPQSLIDNLIAFMANRGGHGSQEVKVANSWLACHEFEPNITEDPPYRGVRWMLNPPRSVLSRLCGVEQWSPTFGQRTVIGEAILIRHFIQCWLNDGRGIIFGRMTHAQRTAEERVTEERRARGNWSTNQVGKQTWSPMEVRAVARYELTHGTSVFAIHDSQQGEYGEKIISHQVVGHWCCMLNRNSVLKHRLMYS
ncbi:hypothetical protein TNCV_3348511 [Trichonephila clavipes]|nr:hypothetical protein TNCV_3348511 [Trichonephila clavipes]